MAPEPEALTSSLACEMFSTSSPPDVKWPTMRRTRTTVLLTTVSTMPIALLVEPLMTSPGSGLFVIDPLNVSCVIVKLVGHQP
jgi:hypothetical protein